NLDRESINTAVRTALIARGEVAEHGLRIGKIEIAVGDTLQALKINGSVENGDPHKVIAIDHHRRTATTLDEAGGEVIFTPAYLENHVAYGYAFTGHKELGESPTENVVLVTAGSDSQWLISAVSRGAVKNTILFASRRPVGAEHHQPAEGVPEKGVQHVQLESALGRDRSKELATATELREQRRAQARVALSAGESRFGRPRPQLVPLASDQRDRDIAASVELTEAVSSGDSKRVRALVEADLTNTFVRAGVPLTPHSAAVRPEVATAEAGLEASEAAASIRTHPGAPLPEPDSRALRLAARARAQKAAQRRRDLQRQQQVEQAAEEKRLRGTVLDRDSGQVQER
ncbi:MAG TPA: hypothetical protein VMV09_09615, partial [Candidatus Saccharimonadales bacterium]|nr:hypothetical protein [Candidatus Saccharimonadales bacterium]